LKKATGFPLLRDDNLNYRIFKKKDSLLSVSLCLRGEY
jgi:hypothetical protein